LDTYWDDENGKMELLQAWVRSQYDDDDYELRNESSEDLYVEEAPNKRKAKPVEKRNTKKSKSKRPKVDKSKAKPPKQTRQWVVPEEPTKRSTIPVGLLKNAFTHQQDGGPTRDQCEGIIHATQRLVKDCSRLSLEAWHAINLYCTKISTDFLTTNHWSNDIFDTVEHGAVDIQSWGELQGGDRFFGRKTRTSRANNVVTTEDRVFNQDFFLFYLQVARDDGRGANENDLRTGPANDYYHIWNKYTKHSMR